MSIKVDYAMIDENNDLNLCNGEKYSHIVATFFIFFYVHFFLLAPYIKSTFQQIANRDSNMSVRLQELL